MANVVSASAQPYQLNGQMLGGLTVSANGMFMNLKGGTSGNYDDTLSGSINNQSLIGALNSCFDAASGNEPGGSSGSIQTNNNAGGFAGADFKYVLGDYAILEDGQELQFRDSDLKISSSINGFLDITADTMINLSGAVGANGAFTAEGAVSGAAGSFDAITGVSLALQGGGITAAGAIAGATTIAASSNATIEGIVSGAAGTFDALGGTSLALQGGGITAAGAIAGATTIAASGLANLNGGIEVDSGGNKFTVSTAGAVVAESSISGAAGNFDAITGVSLALQGGGVTAAGPIAGATTVDASGLITGGGLSDGTATIAVGAGTGFVSINSTSITGSSLNVSNNGNFFALGNARTELSGALHVSGVATFSNTAIVAENGINAKGASTFFGGDSIFGTPGVAGSTLTVMGTTAAGSPMAYRIAVTGGILSVLEAQ